MTTLLDTDTNSTRDPVEDLLKLWEEAFAAGRDIPPEDLCRDRPWLLCEVTAGVAIVRELAAVRGDTAPPVAVAPDPLRYQPGEVVGGRFKLECEIARGGSAVVWRCSVDAGARKVAVKLPRAPHPDPERDVTEQFLREGERVQKLFHPNIVPVFSYGRHAGVAYIAFKLVEGETLADRIRRVDCRISPTAARTIAWHIASALAYAHEKELIHRDLKPTNVLLDPSGWVYLTDFGIALTLGEAADGLACATGTLPYMAPEQLAGGTLDPSCDVYSFGVIIYQMLTGQLPARPEASYADPALSYFCPLLRRCLAPDPRDRYPSGVELRADLRRLMPPGTVPAPPADRPPEPPVAPRSADPPAHRSTDLTATVRRLLSLIAVLVVLLLLGAALIVAGRTRVQPAPTAVALIAACVGLGFAVVRPRRAVLGLVTALGVGLAAATLLSGAVDSLLHQVTDAVNKALRFS